MDNISLLALCCCSDVIFRKERKKQQNNKEVLSQKSVNTTIKKRVRNCNEGGQSLVRISSCLHSELKRGKNSWSSDTKSSGWEAAGGEGR
jgi:hypothetical protein